MKKIIRMSILLLLAGLAACTDNSALKEKVDELEAGQEKLKKDLEELKNTLAELQNAAKEGYTVTDVIHSEEDGREIWTLVLSNGEKYVIKSGKDGEDGEDAECLVKEVDYTSSSRFVDIKLADGTTITLPRTCTLDISFDMPSVTASVPGEVVTVAYTITGGTSKNSVKAVAQGGWTADVLPTDAYSGKIEITAPDPITECEAVVYVSDGEGYMILASIDCLKGTVQFAEDVKTVGWEGGQVQLEIAWDVEYELDVLGDWVNPAGSKAPLNNATLLFSVGRNIGQERFCRINLLTEAGVAGHATIVQDPHPLYANGVFGIFGTGTVDFEYKGGRQQMSAYTAEDEFFFRFTDLSQMKIYEISGIPAEPVKDGKCEATVTVYTAQGAQQTQVLYLTVLSVSMGELKLKGKDAEGIIIRR